MKKRNWMAGVCGAAVIGLLIVGTGTALAGTIPTAQGPLSFFLEKIVRKRIRKRIVTVEVELLGEKRRIELGIRLPEDK